MAMGIANGTRQPEMNVTPLIDVLLVLIIIFMVVTVHSPKGFKTEVPEEDTSTQPAEPNPSLVIEIAADHSLKLNSQPVALENLHGKLLGLWNEKRVVFIKGAQGLYFEDVAQVIDLAKGAGYLRVSLLP